MTDDFKTETPTLTFEAIYGRAKGDGVRTSDK